MKILKKLLIGLALVAGAGASSAAFPDKPVRLIVPTPAGGPTDLVARLVGERLSKVWGQPVLVENRPGATGAIGTEAVARSPADGYTMLVHSPIMISTELMQPSATYRVLRDFAPVSTLLTTSIVLTASNTGTQGGLKEVIAAGKAKPNSLSYGSHGEGTTAHYLGERLKRTAQIEMPHAPFAGESPIVTALMGGHVKLAFISGQGAKKVAESGKVRLLAVASAKRSPLMPEVPTMLELGLEGFDRDSWIMVLAPTGTPKPVVDQVAAEIDKILKTPEMQERFIGLGMFAQGGTANEAAAILKADHEYWVRMVREYGTLVK